MSAVPSDLGPAVFTRVPSAEGGQADLHPTAQGHCSEGLKSWLEKRLAAAGKGEAEIFAQLQRQAHESSLPHEGERHWPGVGSSRPPSALQRLLVPISACEPSRKASFLPETSPPRSEVSDHDSLCFSSLIKHTQFFHLVLM